MSPLPRVAVGSYQPAMDQRPLIWGLMDLLGRAGLQVQSFRSQASFCPWDAAATITGQSARHLDSWIMTPADCRRAFFRGACTSDFALVDGYFDDSSPIGAVGSRLDTLCGWLNLPRLVILDVRRLASCCLPERPPADALLLDGIADLRDLHRWQTSLEALWGIPVLGGMPTCPSLAETVQRLPRGAAPSRELCRALGDVLAPTFHLAALRHLGERYEFPQEAMSDPWAHIHPGHSPINVAMAYDEAFRCYFPDTLDLLETLGVQLTDFSPLRDPDLPPETDVVYFGCGQPDQFAYDLAQNQCMIQALRNHLCAGKRIYAEACALAYLCQDLETPDVGRVPMAGIIPAKALLNPVQTAPQPLEITLARHSWLGNAGMRLRGYLNTNWIYAPSSKVQPLAAEPGHEYDLLLRHQAIGSRLHLNFAAQPDFLRNFTRPHPASLAWTAI